MDFGQAFAAKPASCQTCGCFDSEVDLVNMFEPTRAVAFWAATLTVKIVGVGSHAQASLACMLCLLGKLCDAQWEQV